MYDHTYARLLAAAGCPPCRRAAPREAAKGGPRGCEGRARAARSVQQITNNATDKQNG